MSDQQENQGGEVQTEQTEHVEQTEHSEPQNTEHVEENNGGEEVPTQPTENSEPQPTENTENVEPQTTEQPTTTNEEQTQVEEQKPVENNTITESKPEDVNDNLKSWTSRFVDNCSNEELKSFIQFTLEKIDKLTHRIDEQDKVIKLLQESKGGANLNKIPEATSELLTAPRRGTLRGKKPPTKPLSELGEEIIVERPPEVRTSSSDSSSSNPPMMGIPMMGMKGGGMMMGGMMGELANKLNKRSSEGGSTKSPIVVKQPPLKQPPINPIGVKLKSTTKAPALKLPAKN